MRAEQYQRRREELAEWPVAIASYALGGRFVCEIDNVAGARLARAEGATREEAEGEAMRKAAQRLGRTRVFTVD